jgi:sterol 3beta-glucosyltransferase
MHLSLLAYGTRGDVQPFVALATRLQQAGNTVRLAAPERFAPLAASSDIPFVPLAGDPARFMQELIDRAGRNPLRIVHVSRDFILPLAGQVIAGMRAASAGADIIVHAFLTTTGGHALAREQGIPDVSVQFFPVFAPTGDFPAPALPTLPLGRGYNRLTHHLFTQVFWWGGHIGYNRIRRSHPAFPERVVWPFQSSGRPATPRLYAYSSLVVPHPTDWGSDTYTTGYWFGDGAIGWTPPARLTAFLEAGPPPVCISFGSMVSRATQRIYRIVLGALSQTEQRGLILSGWGEEPAIDLPPNVLMLDAAPHEWLFPRVRVVVHHGGAGTTAATLRAGVPNIIVPFAADQPFWGQQVAKLGVGPAPIAAKRLSVANLSAAIRAALGDAMRQRAADIGRRVQMEDGVGQAIALIERYYDRFKKGSM